jgi:hypothetical protein
MTDSSSDYASSEYTPTEWCALCKLPRLYDEWMPSCEICQEDVCKTCYVNIKELFDGEEFWCILCAAKLYKQLKRSLPK